MKSVLTPSCLRTWTAVVALDPPLQHQAVWEVLLDTGIKRTWKVEGTKLTAKPCL